MGSRGRNNGAYEYRSGFTGGRRRSRIGSATAAGSPRASRGFDGPVGLAQHFAGEEGQVGFAAGDDFVGLMRIGDYADGSGEDCGLFTNRGGEGDLEARRDRDFRVGDQSAAGAIHQIDAERFQGSGELDGLVEIPAAFDPIGGGNADEQRHRVGHDAADRR